ncbi:MAG TPA: hypothetical protein VGC64_00520 [Pyrinomonadaceae bacterium]|jgi:hypothetical protein
MSDFLHSLIARSYGLKPVAQPRLASRFEPQPGSPLSMPSPVLAPDSFMSTDRFAEQSAAPASSFHEADTNGSSSESMTEATGPETPTKAWTGQPITRPLKTEWRPDDAAPPLYPTSFVPLNNDEARARSSHPAQHQRFDIQESTDRAAQDPGGVRAQPASVFTIQMAAEFLLNERRQLERDAGVRETNRPSSTTGSGREDQPAPGDERLAADAVSSNQRDGELARRAVVPVRTTAQPNTSAERAASVSAGSRSGVDVESLSPTIRVTIGRIDVRAVMPEAGAARQRAAAAAAPPRPKHSPLSLEEYLKQRNGGGR